MLGEMQVIEAVCELLEDQHYGIDFRVKKTSERGPDIIASCEANRTVIIVEAKGQTSSNERSNRFGLEFQSKQMNSHVGVALVKSLQITSGRIPKKALELLGEDLKNRRKLAGLAFPDNHKDLVDSMGPALIKLGVIVFLVSKGKKARIHSGELPTCSKK
jgi:hypothetical protein